MPTLPCREQVVQAFKARLVALGVSIATDHGVERDRVDRVEDTDLPRLVIYEGACSPVGDDATGERAYWLAMDVEGAVTGADADACAQALSILRATVEATLLAPDAMVALKIRDLVINEEPPPQRLELNTQGPAKAFVASYHLQFATAESDPFTFS